MTGGSQRNQRLGPSGVSSDASVVISTIQRVYAQLCGEESSQEEEEASGYETDAGPSKTVAYNPQLPPEAFMLQSHLVLRGSVRD